jgi:hypothetical protein
MELHIINKNNQLIEIISLENNHYNIALNNQHNPLPVDNTYIYFVCYLQKPINKLLDNHNNALNDGDIINNTIIKDCCKVINMLKIFLKKDYIVKVSS